LYIASRLPAGKGANSQALSPFASVPDAAKMVSTATARAGGAAAGVTPIWPAGGADAAAGCGTASSPRGTAPTRLDANGAKSRAEITWVIAGAAATPAFAEELGPS